MAIITDTFEPGDVFLFEFEADHKQTILGKGGDDILIGGPGNDTLVGHHGKDTVKGGAGTDNLVGISPFGPDPSASDTFVMERGGGLDTIGDFTMTGPNRDRLDLSRWKPAGPAALASIDVAVGATAPVLGGKSLYPGG